ncbi:MAG TPA: hypothetical protein VFE47_15485 [Tepidisphaeraceae bacterium]|jgi:Leucine-rich repeat (LRR) protein|nr:hypothetical protein [Tepidisphaeraceae bacterium]
MPALDERSRPSIPLSVVTIFLGVVSLAAAQDRKSDKDDILTIGARIYIDNNSVSPSSRFVDLSGTGATDADLKSLFRLTNVTGISLSRTQVTDEGMGTISQLSALQTIDLTATKIGDKGIEPLGKLKALRQLSLPTNITDRALVTVGKFDNLEELSLPSPYVTADGIKFLSRLQKLRKCDLSGTRLDSAGYSSLGQLKGLNELSLTCNSSLTDSNLKTISELRGISRLEIFATPAISGEGIAFLRNMHSLRSLSLQTDNVENAQANGLGSLAALAELQDISLAGWNLRDKDIAELKVFLSLTSVRIKGRHIDDDGFANLIPLKKLRLIDVSHSGVSDQSMTLLRSFPDLIDLDVSSTHITDNAMPPICMLKNLRSLSLAYTRVHDTNINQIAAMKELRLLNLSGTACTDAAIREIAKLPNLTVLMAPEQMTNAGLESLLSTKVTSLDLSFTKITDDGVSALSRMSEIEELSKYD